jgi:spore germination cell wall hydrolase CwlJ-like protein
MKAGNPGLSAALARDAATVIGTVLLITGLGVKAQAEPVVEPTQAAAASTMAPETGTPNQGTIGRPNAEDAFRAREVNCLAEAVYYESKGEPHRGQLAVAEVVANRVAHRAFPNTFCGVVHQRTARTCQFSWVCSPRRAPRGLQWERARDIAERVVDGHRPGVVPGAVFFHATYVRPSWANVSRRVSAIGNHIFYRAASAR